MQEEKIDINYGGSCSGGISKVYLLNPKDIVIENGVFVKMKRKYGKYKREVLVIDCNSK